MACVTQYNARNTEKLKGIYMTIMKLTRIKSTHLPMNIMKTIKLVSKTVFNTIMRATRVI